MEPALRIVTTIPLGALWNEAGPLPYRRSTALGSAKIKEHLRSKSAEFVIADVGSPLHWIDGPSVEQLKQLIKNNLVEPIQAETGFDLTAMRGNFAYVASEWIDEQTGNRAVLLEKYH